MFQLKEYQQRALDALSYYFRTTSEVEDADTAFYQVTKHVFGRGIPYNPVQVDGLTGLPYVCLRMPTGAGKTYVAAHAVGTATRDLLEADRSLVLWLVPTTSILEQTIEALKDPKHPYRQAIVDAVGSVRVMDVTEALYLNRATLDTETTIIVSTIQSFRVEDTEGRKVYAADGALMDHFSGIPDEIKSQLEPRADGTVIPSLANVLRLRRPIVIVDEAHNARTDLSFDTLARFRPACILELTATPAKEKQPSNILHSVSAAELKAEEMIKLPIELHTTTDWKNLVNRAVAQRNLLERIAKKERAETGEYIRPILLLQAEANRGTDPVTVDVVKKTLMKDHQIPEKQIALATGSYDDLEGVDILSSECPIRYVITVQKLKEGWDCPFAYVLCSVSELRSNIAIEQIVGRILRMPQARKKVHDALNKAYAFSASPHFAPALDALKDVLVENGFERQEADTLVRRAMQNRDGGDDEAPNLFSDPVPANTTIRITVNEPPKDYADLPAVTRRKTSFDVSKGTLTVKGTMTEADRDALKSMYTTPEAREAVENAFEQSRVRSRVDVRAPVERGEKLVVPQLVIRQGELYEEFEKTHVLEIPWKLSECDPTLPDFELPTASGKKGLVDVGKEGKVETRFVNELHSEMLLLADDYGWSVSGLVYWLDHSFPHQDIPPQETGIYLTNLVQRLIDERGFTLDQLVHFKYTLKKAVEKRVDEHRKAAQKRAYQRLLSLDEGEGKITVDPEVCFSYPEEYPYSSIYDGSYDFQKHYYPVVGDLNKEEEACARFLDEHPDVEYWVRNLERRPNHAFWLQTSTDRFYPDFVCKLNDGRILVVEYKGADRWSNEDSKEKRTLGELWARRSDDQCLFVMPKGKDLAKIKKVVESEAL